MSFYVIWTYICWHWKLPTADPPKKCPRIKVDIIVLLFTIQNHVRGHQGIFGNEEADKLAVEGARKPYRYRTMSDGSCSDESWSIVSPCFNVVLGFIWQFVDKRMNLIECITNLPTKDVVFIVKLNLRGFTALYFSLRGCVMHCIVHLTSIIECIWLL